MNHVLRFGDVYQYKDKLVNGVPSRNMVVISLIGNEVICTDESTFKTENLSAKTKNFFLLPFRKIPLNKFNKWYPIFNYNLQDKN